MAVAPWSWTSSNGTASAAQTKAAYAALTSNGNTAAFHRYVWNDLVSRVNEVLTALNLSWADTYGSFVDTRMNYPYEELTAKRFNSVRLNARYPAWTWKYDTTTPGYIGRTDFRGVSYVGETQADIVYGYYIIELTERLNKIIGILNGTEPYYDLISNSRSTLAPVPNLIILPGKITYADGRIIQSANAEVKNIAPSSIINNFSINGPITRAVMESEQFSNYFARVEMNLLFTRAIKLLPSVLFVVSSIMALSGSLFVDAVPPMPLTTYEQSEIIHSAHPHNLPSAGIVANGIDSLLHEAAGVKLPPAAINSNYVISSIIPQGLVELSRLNDGRAPVTMFGTPFGKLRTSTPLGFISEGSVVLSNHVHGEIIPVLSILSNEQSEVTNTAYIYKLPSVNISSSVTDSQSYQAIGTTLPPKAVNSTYVNSAVQPQGNIDASKIKGGRAAAVIKDLPHGTLRTAPYSGIMSGVSHNLSTSASLHQTDEFRSTNATMYSDVQPRAILGKLENMVPLSAGVTNSLYPSAIPNMRMYIHARTSFNMTLSYHSLLQLNTTWEYPLHMGDDLSIRQLWQTEENSPHLFFDFDRFRVKTTDTVGFATRGLTLLPLPFGASDGFVITSTPIMQAYNPSLWEHPIKTDNDLYIKQSEQKKLKKHRLEVK